MLHTYLATVHSVVSGDTICVDVDLGFRIHKVLELRLKGVRAVEPNYESLPARQFVIDQLSPHPVIAIQTFQHQGATLRMCSTSGIAPTCTTSATMDFV